ncbi:lamin tail domain-containing protein [Microbacterium rhizomatis]|uniref:lamin tail domain-containing protein n=1 Tax=Microbacterium rhizomatis TaxID=1631477 RepID=UPI001B876607|nr:lamin tail domain-containing protein [Microbacterium rhizomatis]
MRRQRRPILAALTAAALTTSFAAVVTPLTLSAASADTLPTLVVNEVDASGVPADWIEIKNTGTAPVDASGYILKDDKNTSRFDIPAGTVIAAGGYATFDVGSVFGLGKGGDAARLFLPDNTTLIDGYTWPSDSVYPATWGRCDDGTGAFVVNTTPSKGAANVCGTTTPTDPTDPTDPAPTDPVTSPWPGGSTVVDANVPNFAPFSSNLSGLSYELGTAGAADTLWAVRNGPGALFALQKSGTTWVPASGWETGKALRYPNGTGDVDAEGVVQTDHGLFVSSERNNSANSVSRPAVLRYDSTTGTELTASIEWNLAPALPTVGANLGLEGITFVPDSYLVGKGFRDNATGATYDPATYAGHGSGLYFVGLEGTGSVYAFALDQTDGSKFTLVATIATGFPNGVMEVQYDAEKAAVWAVCDDTCGGKFALFDIGTDGNFAKTITYDRPAGLLDSNNEGFTTAPQALCVDGTKPVFWADDNNLNGIALREGTIDCTPLGSGPDSQSQQLQVVVPLSGPGEFIWSIDGTNGVVDLGTAVNSGDHFTATGSINPIKVTDTRVTAPSWSISGQVGAFTSGVTTFSGANLGWTPSIIAPGAGAVAGAPVAPAFDGGPGLAGSATLGSAPAGHAKGSAKLGAGLELKIPIDVTDGTYTATLTLTGLS